VSHRARRNPLTHLAFAGTAAALAGALLGVVLGLTRPSVTVTVGPPEAASWVYVQWKGTLPFPVDINYGV
jgi:hypothetical protein